MGWLIRSMQYCNQHFIRPNFQLLRQETDATANQFVVHMRYPAFLPSVMVLGRARPGTLEQLDKPQQHTSALKANAKRKRYSCLWGNGDSRSLVAGRSGTSRREAKQGERGFGHPV
jgi:hypothetical protein